MNLYGIDYSLLDLDFTDQSFIGSLSTSPSMIMDRKHREREEEDLIKLSNSILKSIKRNDSPPKHRHDGKSPLPLGMDWSPTPRNWAGRNTIWPHDFHTGWSYCVTVPSWTILSESGGSKPVVFYRVQVGLQSPEGVTTTRGVLKRFSDFLGLSSDLQRFFRKKKFPPFPPKGLLRMKSGALLEERRRSLEDWMEKILSDIDISRSVPIACFLELEAAARSSFSESSDHEANGNLRGNNGSSSDILSGPYDGPAIAETSRSASNCGFESVSQTSHAGSDRSVKDTYSELDKDNPTSDKKLSSLTAANADGGASPNDSLSKEVLDGNEEKYLHKMLHERINKNENGSSSGTLSENSNLCAVHRDRSTSPQHADSVDASETMDELSISDFQISPEILVLLPTNERQKMNRILTNMQQRLITSKTDVEDLIARLNQELAVRDYLTTKVKDLEIELESTKNGGKENLEQAILNEKEKYTQSQWDVEELRRKCMQLEFSLKTEQDEKADLEAYKTSLIQENEVLKQELDSALEKFQNLQKCHEVADLKSKSDVKLLVKEVKSLRSSQSELQQELDRLAEERTDLMTRLQKEREKRENVNAANKKLLHECEILRGRLEECSIKFLIEEETKIHVDASSPSDALDILDTSENRIGLLLAEAQLLAQDDEIPVTSASLESDDVAGTDDEFRKMLTDVLLNNVILRKQVNSIMRSSLSSTDASSDGSVSVQEVASSRKPVVSKFLEK